MATKKVRPRFKSVDLSARQYHHYEYSPSEFGLFDDADDGTPIVVGSRNLVDAIIRTLSKSVTIFYYKKNPLGYWEKKIIYTGKKEEK